MTISDQAGIQTLAVNLVEQAIRNAKEMGVSNDRLYDTVKSQGIGTGQPAQLLEVERPKPQTRTIFTVWGVMPDRSLRLFGAVDDPEESQLVWDTLKTGAGYIVGEDNVRVASVEVEVPLKNLIEPIHKPRP